MLGFQAGFLIRTTLTPEPFPAEAAEVQCLLSNDPGETKIHPQAVFPRKPDPASPIHGSQAALYPKHYLMTASTVHTSSSAPHSRVLMGGGEVWYRCVSAAAPTSLLWWLEWHLLQYRTGLLPCRPQQPAEKHVTTALLTWELQFCKIKKGLSGHRYQEMEPKQGWESALGSWLKCRHLPKSLCVSTAVCNLLVPNITDLPERLAQD